MIPLTRGRVTDPDMTGCPSPETLVLLGEESLSESRFAALESHVQTCSHCQVLLEQWLHQRSGATDWSGRFEAPGEPEPPPRIAGFVVERELGRGGMGTVYLAWQPQLARRVAIKVIRAGRGPDASTRRRWLREVQALGKLRHPNIVSLLQADDQDEQMYLVLEYIAGGSVRDRLSGPLPPRVAVSVIEAIARAAAAIHEAGLLHLDIKPSNILLDGPTDHLGAWDWSASTPKLADFGIARMGSGASTGDSPATEPLESLTETLGVAGTPSFMAPEQILKPRAGIGPTADVFALGATLYCLLTGRPPFQAATLFETLELVRTRDPASPRALVPGLSRDLETITFKCLRKEPRHRYSSAAELAEELRRWLDGFPIKARRTSHWERSWFWARRHPAISALSCGLFVSLTCGLIGLALLWQRAETSLARALDNQSRATRSLGDLLGVISTTLNAPHLMTQERLDHACQVTRAIIDDLRRTSPPSPTSLLNLADLADLVTGQMKRRGRFAEAGVLVLEVVSMIDRVLRDPGSHASNLLLDLQIRRAGLLVVATDLELHARPLDPAAQLDRLALQQLRSLPNDPRVVGILLDLLHIRLASIRELRLRSESELADRLQSPLLSTLEEFRSKFPGDPTIAMAALLWRVKAADALTADEALDPIRYVLASFDRANPLPERIRVELGSWLGECVEPWLRGEYPSATTPTEAASQVLADLDRLISTLGLSASEEFEMARALTSVASMAGTHLRKVGKPLEARWSAEFLVQFAKLLIARDPKQSIHHALLCVAYEQKAKNAVRDHDPIAQIEWLRIALTHAREAYRLAPDDPLARIQCAGNQDKLRELEHEHQTRKETSSAPAR